MHHQHSQPHSNTDMSKPKQGTEVVDTELFSRLNGPNGTDLPESGSSVRRRLKAQSRMEGRPPPLEIPQPTGTPRWESSCG